MGSRNPSNWDEYERGISPIRAGSVSSAAGRSVQFQDDDSYVDGEEDAEWPGRLRRRRSSVTMRLAALTDIGGVNSIRSFTRSWQRAASFAEVIPQRPSFVFAPDQAPLGGPAAADGIQYGPSHVERGTLPERTSLLRQHLEAPPIETVVGENASVSGPAGPRNEPNEQPPVDFRERERKALDNELSRAFQVGSCNTSTSIFATPPHLATPIVGSYASYRSSIGSYRGTYGTIPFDQREARSPLSGPGATAFWSMPGPQGEVARPDSEAAPILVKEVEQDGKMVLTVEGQSTLPQTIFNSINVLIGVGLLSLPMGIRYAGWICGIGFLTLAAAVTAYTASLLVKCMDLDASLITFSDVAFISFGSRARLATSVLFTLELVAANVALVVLFADSLDLLFPGLFTVLQWKIFCAAVLVPLHFLPLRLLSYSSIIGIFSCFGIVVIVVINGLIKQEAPGSLIEPAATFMFPANWLTLPLSFGLLMSPWGGHSVFPNIYRDMRHPYKYGQAVRTTFSFTYLLDATTAVVGILMFGDDVMDEITSNIITTSGYPRALTLMMCAFIAIIPLTKIPLNARPIITTLEVLLGVYQQPQMAAGGDGSSTELGWSETSLMLIKAALRVGTVFTFLVISIVFPAFDRIMAFMGSALCFTICVTLPIAFYLKLFGRDISAKEWTFACLIMTLSAVASVVGTVWAFLPKSLIGVE